MAISRDYLEGLTKQVFILDYLLHGLFPCQSDIVRLIRSKKRAWEFNDKFEYRMLLANTNTGGTLSSQIFKENVGLIKPGQIDFGTFRASYGTVADGFDINMMANLETKNKKGAFETDYATKFSSLRYNVASLFKNFAIHGQYGVVHQLRSSIAAPVVDPTMNPVANVGPAPTVGVPFTIKAPINVFNSNFKRGKYLIKTQGARPWGPAAVEEMYIVLENQPGYLSLMGIGTTCSAFNDGDFLEVAGNRELTVGPAQGAIFQNWNYGAITVTTAPNGGDSPFKGSYDQFMGTSPGGYSVEDPAAGTSGVVGAPEGLADLFPWYTDPAAPTVRLGLNIPFRDQPNRLRYSTEQAGNFVYQMDGEHIIDCIMRASFLTKSVVPYADVGIWLNPMTRQYMGYEEGQGVTVLRDNFVAGPIVFQRGVTTHEYQIGNHVVKEVVEDFNMPTDVIVIGPKNDIGWNCFDNSLMQIDDYIQESWAKNPPKTPADIEQFPQEFTSKLDIENRVYLGSVSMRDGGMARFDLGSRIRHPENSMPIALQEMGALFTEYPSTYTVIKLREPITDLIST